MCKCMIVKKIFYRKIYISVPVKVWLSSSCIGFSNQKVFSILLCVRVNAKLSWKVQCGYWWWHTTSRDQMTSLLSLASIRITVLMWRCWNGLRTYRFISWLIEPLMFIRKLFLCRWGCLLSVPYSNSCVDILEICVFRHVPTLIIYSIYRWVEIEGQRIPFWLALEYARIRKTCYTHKCIRVLTNIYIILLSICNCKWK